MNSEIPLTLQTAYAELVGRSTIADFERAFEDAGAFTPKTVKGRRYWYFQVTQQGRRRQRYVGPESPELLDRIARHRRHTDDQKERRALVSILVRSAYLPKPPEEVGKVVAALAEAGVFRLRGVLVGTVAFQTYSAMLGVRLPNAAIQTDDVDIAQDRNVSIAMHDKTPPLIEVLRKVDPDFRDVPTLHGPATFSYRSRKLRVDILTPNTGPDSDTPVRLPAFGTDAQQLRFLDFLIRDPEPAVLLHNEGVYVTVPSPERFALHKLIVAKRRIAGSGKSGKDLRQASALIAVLVKARHSELCAAWEDVFARGAKWRTLLLDGLISINASVRDELLKTVGKPRSTLSRIDVRFEDTPPHYDFVRDFVAFRGVSMSDAVNFGISREALDDHFGADGLDKGGRLRLFREHRSQIEAMARSKYLKWPIEDPALTLLKSEDIPKLTGEISPRKRART